MGPKIFSELPTDIINLIVPYLDHEITSILNKNWRLKYLEKYGVTIDFIYLGVYRVKDIGSFADKYPETNFKLIGFDQKVKEMATHYLKLYISKKIKVMKNAYISDMQDFVSRFPNTRVSGIVITSSENIEIIRSDKTGKYKKLRFIITFEESLALYKSSLLSNLIVVHYINGVKSEQLHEIGNKIYGIVYEHIDPKISYPNLRYIIGCITNDSITKSNLHFPRLKAIMMPERPAKFTVEFLEKYTKDRRIIIDFGEKTNFYRFYTQIRRLPIIIMTEIYIVRFIFDFEIKYREDFPETYDKLDLIINRNAIMDKSYPGMEYFNIFYR